MDKSSLLIVIYSIVIAVLFVFSAFFSSADMAYGSVSELRLESYIKSTGSKRATVALKLSKKYDNTISTILFLNDFVNVGSETIAALLGYLVFEHLGLENPGLGSFVGSAIVLGLIIVFGEILPKSVTKPNCFKYAIRYAYVINVFTWIFYPFTFVATKLGKLVTKPFTKQKEKVEITDEELEEMVDVIEKEGVVDKENADILRGTIDYASKEAYEIMTPRVDIFAIDFDEDINELIKDEQLFVHSRIPVYKDTIDNIIGFVTTKDLIRCYLSKEIPLENILKKPLRFPRSTEINDILKEFKITKIHFAVVIDEYGGVEGIVTMEDILEEIVGEIWDEEDDVDEPINKIGDDSYMVDGSMNLDDFFDQFDINYDEIETDYVTIGGYCIELLDDRFAKVGDVIYFKNLIMKVIAVDETNTIQKILVKVRPEE